MKPLIALTLLAFTAAADAQTPASPPIAPPATGAVTPPPVILPAAKPAPAKKPRAAKAPAAANPNLVAFKTSTGKTIHYDCSKAGNKTKTACRK